MKRIAITNHRGTRELSGIASRVVTILAISCCAGCMNSAGDRLIGTWEGVPESAHQAMAENDAIDDPATPPLPTHELAESVRVRFEFLDHKRVRMTLSRSESQALENTILGNWKVVGQDADRLTVRVAPQVGRTDSKDLEIIFDGEDRFRATEIKGDDRMPAILFQRTGPS
jgi:hypothetical protein